MNSQARHRKIFRNEIIPLNFTKLTIQHDSIGLTPQCMMGKQKIHWIVLGLICLACQPAREIKTTGSIERLDPALDNIISSSAVIEIVSEGLEWSEGPLWVEDQKMLLFSDVPKNIVYQWTEEKGTEVYLTPSGWMGSDTGKFEGSNGLLLDDEGKLVLCQHGDRRLARMVVALTSPKPEFETLADKYEGKKFNSPNDAVFRGGDYFFTDPAYGLAKQMDDPRKEISFQGVYRRSVSGEVTLLVDSLTRPNGIAFSPNGDLFIANSDREKARWYRYHVKSTPVPEEDPAVTLSDGKVFYDATALTATEKGLPDGMKIDSKGNIFASGPGGVFIFDAEGKLLGKIKLADATSNTALSADEKTLFVTNDMYVLRIKMRK